MAQAPVHLRGNRLKTPRAAAITGILFAVLYSTALATIWLRTGTAPRVLVAGTYALALVLLFSLSLSIWLTFVFPVWVLVISVYILVENLRNRSTGTQSNPETA